MLNHFQTALARYKDEIGYNQYWRYSRGKIPRIVSWIAERPELAQALLNDAQILQKQNNLANGETDE